MPAKRGSAAPLPRNIRERKLPDGSGSFTLDLRDQHGQRVRETVSAYCDAISRKVALKTAVRVLAQRRTEIAAGNFLSERQRAAAERSAEAARDAERGPLFREFAQTFLRDYCAGKTRSRFHVDRIAVLTRQFGTRYLSEIARADLDAYAAARAREVKASTVRRDLAVLRVLFKMAVRWGVLKASPAVDLVGPKEPPHRTRFLSPEEYRRLESEVPPWLRPIVRFAVLTGLRLKEITGIRWADIDRARGTLTLSGDNKTASVRTIPLSGAARSVLDAQARHVRTLFVFVDATGRPFTDEQARHRIVHLTSAAARTAGLPGVTFHVLRHTAGTWLAQAKVPLAEILLILGHSDPRITQRYVNLVAEDCRAAVEALGSVLGGHETDTGHSTAFADANGSAVND